MAKGTVAALKPSPALTVPDNITVAEASQLCAAKRTDCVLVVDDDEGLSGIFTAKDLAYRVSAEGLDPHSTPVSQIMTRSPMVTRDTTSATEALQLMVQRHFRHLVSHHTCLSPSSHLSLFVARLQRGRKCRRFARYHQSIPRGPQQGRTEFIRIREALQRSCRRTVRAWSRYGF